MDRIWNTLKPKKVLWINFSVLFAVYAICIFSHHASPDYYCSMMYGNADINLQNGRFLNWFLYYTADLLGIEMEKNSVFSQFVWTVSCAVSSYWVYSAFIKEVEDTSINRLMIQLASLIMFINISLWEGWYSFPETVLFATVNLLACYGAVALFAKGYRERRIGLIALSYLLATVAIYGYQVYVEHYIILTAVYLLCHHRCRMDKRGIGYTLEVVGVSAWISLSTILTMSLLVRMGITRQVDRAATFGLQQIIENLKTLWSMQHRIWSSFLGYMPAYAMPVLGVLLLAVIVVVLTKIGVLQALWTGTVLLGCYVSVFLPHIVTSNIWCAPRTIVGLFCFAGGLLCLAACMITHDRVKWVMSCVAMLFLVVSAVQIQIISVNNIISTRIDQIQIREIQREVEAYELESGVQITTFAVGDDGSKNWSNETVEYCLYDTNLRILSVYYSDIVAINYYTGRNYTKRQMTEEEYHEYFDGRTYDHFDVDDQLRFDGDTAFLLSY